MAVVRTVRETPTELPGARLYLDDLEEISNVLLSAFKSESQDDSTSQPSITYRIGNTVVDSISDLRERGGTVSKLEIKAESGNSRGGMVTISFYNVPRPRIYLGGWFDDKKEWAVYSRVRAVFDSKRFVLRNAIADLPNWVDTAAFITALVLPALLSALLTKTSWKLYAASLLGYYSFGGLLLWYSFRPSQVVLSYSHEHSKVSAQARRGYIRDVGMIVLGAVIGKSVEVVFSKFLK